MLKYLLISILMVSSVALSAQLSFSGTTAGSAPTANFALVGATSGNCAAQLLRGANEPYRVFTFKATATTTVTVNFSNYIDGGGMSDYTDFAWYTGTSFNPASTCTNLITVGDNYTPTNKSISVTANASYSIAVIGSFGAEDAFAGTLTAAAGTVLPIELLSFTAKNTEGGKNHLSWATASEKNNSHFDIERSTDGNSFLPIGQVKGNNKASSYQFVDNQPFATTYYRLRQIDFDGTETYSKIVSVVQTGKSKGLAVYPNPVSSLLNVVYTDGTSRENREGSSFQILNLLGQQVLTGKTAAQVDVSALPQGTYILKVGAEQVKFLKQ